MGQSPTVADVARAFATSRETGQPIAFFDEPRGKFILKNARGAWISVNIDSLKRILCRLGYTADKRPDEKQSEIDTLIVTIQNYFDVQFVGPVSGIGHSAARSGCWRI